jgi:predicted metal-dependent HD superfamily phosphohydrolase
MTSLVPRVEFNRLWADSGCQGNGNAVFHDLVQVYSAPRRHYHTLAHVMLVLERISEILDAGPADFTVRDYLALQWAAWFHDAVMFVSVTDVMDSAFMAAEVLRQAGLSYPLIDTVHRLILATGHDRDKLYWDEAILVDADLSILGADREQFDEYERLVRLEYPDVSDVDFAAGRAKILKRFLDRHGIYFTEYGRKSWENKARANLRYSIHKLGAR